MLSVVCIHAITLCSTALPDTSGCQLRDIPVVDNFSDADVSHCDLCCAEVFESEGGGGGKGWGWVLLVHMFIDASVHAHASTYKNTLSLPHTRTL